MTPTTRCELVQAAIDAIKANTYLEIGIDNGYTFNNVRCPIKASVDPNHNPTYKLTSDEYFKQYDTKFDVIFIDGLHEKEQVIRDINNSVKCLNSNGIIITHDTVLTHPCQTDKTLCGTTWEAFAHLRITNPHIFMASVMLSNDSVGCGIIRHGHQTPYAGEIPKNWEEYINCRDQLMNVIPIEKVMEMWQS